MNPLDVNTPPFHLMKFDIAESLMRHAVLRTNLIIPAQNDDPVFLHLTMMLATIATIHTMVQASPDLVMHCASSASVHDALADSKLLDTPSPFEPENVNAIDLASTQDTLHTTSASNQKISAHFGSFENFESHFLDLHHSEMAVNFAK
jgi:hypothetical protein